MDAEAKNGSYPSSSTIPFQRGRKSKKKEKERGEKGFLVILWIIRKVMLDIHCYIGQESGLERKKEREKVERKEEKK